MWGAKQDVSSDGMVDLSDISLAERLHFCGG